MSSVPAKKPRKKPRKATPPEAKPAATPVGTPVPGFNPSTVLNGSVRATQIAINKNVKEGVWGLYEIVALHTVESGNQKRKSLLDQLIKIRDYLIGQVAKPKPPAAKADAPGADLPPRPKGVSAKRWAAIQAPVPSERLCIQKFGRYYRLIKGSEILGHYQQQAQAERAKVIYETTGKKT